jgi:hypothetical protein
MSVNVIDLRGEGGHTGGVSVLADPSGRRHRLLTGIGRIVASALVVWLCGLVVAGLGLLPAPIVPFALFVGPQSSPPRLARLPASRPPTRADLRPAAPASGAVGGAHASHALRAAGALIGHRHAAGGRSRGGDRPASPETARGGFRSPTKPTLLPTPNMPVRSVAGAPVPSGTAGTTQGAGPIQSGTAGPPVAAPAPSGAKGTGTAGSSGEAEPPGAPGRSGSAPGRASETTTTQTATSPSLPGASGSAPGTPEARGHEKTTPVATTPVSRG